MTAMQVIEVVNSGRVLQVFEGGGTAESCSFSVMVTPVHAPIECLIPSMFGCQDCGTAWMITSPAPFGTCRDCGRQLELTAP